MTQTDHVEEQIRYYRARAAEYDATAYPLGKEDIRIERIVDGLRPNGRILEIACGTGAWTVHLARWTSELTAVDSSPEMIEIAKAKCSERGVRFRVGDAFDLGLNERFDTVFFGFWLSHVPASRFDSFWSGIRGMLDDGARVAFVDERRHGLWSEEFVGEGTVERRLQDGTAHRLIKVLWEPRELEVKLAGLGWRAVVEPVGTTWMAGQAWPATESTESRPRRFG